MGNLAIIPARGGSKRIPLKNIKDFCGHPILRYPIREATLSGLFDKIIVSTDDFEIARIAINYAEIPFYRSSKNANDTTPLTHVVLEVLNTFHHDYAKNFDKVCCILPTAVFVTEEDLQKSYKLSRGNDSVIAISKYNHPIQRAFEYNAGYIQMIYPEFSMTRTQDLKSHYYDAGQFYWINVESFKKQQKIFMKKSIGYEIEAIDINNEEDWEKAENLYQLKRRKDFEF